MFVLVFLESVQIRPEFGIAPGVYVELQRMIPEVVHLVMQEAFGAYHLRGVQLVPLAELREGELGGIAVHPAFKSGQGDIDLVSPAHLTGGMGKGVAAVEKRQGGNYVPCGIFRVGYAAGGVAFAAVFAQVKLGGAGLCTAEAGADGILSRAAGRARRKWASGEFQIVEERC